MILTPCRLYIACTVLFSLKITYRKRRNYDEEVFFRRYAKAALERLRVRVSAADLSERQTNPFDGQPEQAGTDAVHTVYRSTSSRTAHGRFYFPEQGGEVMGVTLREWSQQWLEVYVKPVAKPSGYEHYYDICIAARRSTIL